MSRPYILLNSRQPLVFDGNQAECFIIALNNDVETSRVKNIIPGVLYTFVLHQNGAGGYSFVWPPQCKNAASINTAQDATTVQNFIGLTGNYLLADPPGTSTFKEPQP
jgi:hypothetical protein